MNFINIFLVMLIFYFKPSTEALRSKLRRSFDS